MYDMVPALKVRYEKSRSPMNLLCLVLGIIICVIGVVFIAGKGHSRLAAWRSMSPAEQARILIGPLSRNIGAMIMLCGIIFLIAAFNEAFKDHVFMWAMIVWFVAAGLDVFFIGRGGRYILPDAKDISDIPASSQGMDLPDRTDDQKGKR